MKVYIIGAGAGDPELLTIKGKKAIEESQVIIYAGSLVNPKILKYNPEAEIYNSAALNLDEIISIIKEAAAENKNIARIHTGDPSIYGAIKEQIDLLEKNNIDYQIIPGVSSFLAGAAALSTEYTLPGVSQTVILTRQEGRTSVPKKEKLSLLAEHKASMVIFLSIQMIEEVVDELLEGYNLDTPAAVVANASWSEELVIKGTLADIAEKVKKAGIKSTALIMVGNFLDSDYKKSKLYDKNYTHDFRSSESDKKAILVVSFGTSYQETRKKTIKACENKIAEEFPEYDIKRAFTSKMIIRKLKSRDGIKIDTPKQALNKLYQEGYQEVIVQPLHIINGSEFHELVRDVKDFKNHFKTLKWGNALLSKTSDYFDVAKILKTEVKNDSADQAVLLMGHGSSHAANSDYAALDYVLKEKGMDNYYVGAVEGYPEIEVVIKQLKKKQYNKVKLTPLMLVAGDHAQNDMAGDGEESWKSVLKNEGFEVEIKLKGLGEYKKIQNKYAKKVSLLQEE